MKFDARQILRTLKENLDKITDIHLAIVFGSTVSGKLRQHSDIDIAISTGDKISFQKWGEFSVKLSKSLPLEIDLSDLHVAHGLFLNQILTTGKVLKNTRSEIRADLISRMLTEKEDWFPIQEKIRHAHVMRFIHE